MTWQPIETAPKDGTAIDVWLPTEDGGQRIANAYWGTEYVPWECPKQKTGWCAELIGIDGSSAPIAYDADDSEPTHWMPLPEPPTSA